MPRAYCPNRECYEFQPCQKHAVRRGEQALLTFLEWFSAKYTGELEDLGLLPTLAVTRALALALDSRVYFKLKRDLFGPMRFTDGMSKVWRHRNNPARLLHIATYHKWPATSRLVPAVLRELYQPHIVDTPGEGYWQRASEVSWSANLREGPVEQMVSLPGGSGFEMTHDGEFPLLKAAYAGDREKVLSLLRQGADVLMQTRETLLTAAMPPIYRRFPVILCDLVAFGADLHVRDHNGFMAYHYAVKRDYHEELAVCLSLSLPSALVLQELVLYSVARRARKCLALVLPFVQPSWLDQVRRDMEILPISDTNNEIRQMLGLPPRESSGSFTPVVLSTASVQAEEWAQERTMNLLEVVRSGDRPFVSLDAFINRTCGERGVTACMTRGFSNHWRFHVMNTNATTTEQEERDLVLKWCFAKGLPSVTWINCYDLVREHGASFQRLRSALDEVLFRGLNHDWVHAHGLEALFMGFEEPEEDTVLLEMSFNNFSRISFGVIHDRYLRRRTSSLGGDIVTLNNNGMNYNLFLQLGHAGGAHFPLGASFSGAF